MSEVLGVEAYVEAPRTRVLSRWRLGVRLVTPFLLHAFNPSR
jgi:hypothetical protein